MLKTLALSFLTIVACCLCPAFAAVDAHIDSMQAVPVHIAPELTAMHVTATHATASDCTELHTFATLSTPTAESHAAGRSPTVAMIMISETVVATPPLTGPADSRDKEVAGHFAEKPNGEAPGS